MTTFRNLIARMSAAMIALGFLASATAAPLEPGAVGETGEAIDPPARVGRLSHTEGTVSFHSQGQDEWAPATLNFPVTTGDSFWTETDSRAEIQIGAVALRMDETTEITAARIDEDATGFEIHQGTVNVTVAAPPESPVELKLPLGEVKLLEAGRYRINAGTPYYGAPPEAMQVTVFEGEARFDSDDGTRVIESGEAVSMGGDPLVFTEAEAVMSAFDEWARSRDPEPLPAAAGAPVSDSPEIVWNQERAIPAPRSSATLDYVSPRMTGYQDLDRYGSWAVTADYGPVWYPESVPHGWAPYRYGHWAYVPPWGWTWIDDAPWGFAPFHYGRWVTIGSRWGWCPGAYVPRPVYAPALVAFIGGSNWSIGISIGGGHAIGWVPLSPFDHYRPHFKASRHYVKRVNVTHITVNKTVINKNVTIINEGGGGFVNRRGATVVSSEAFTRGARVHRARLDVGERDIKRARLRNSLADVRPSPRARLGLASDRPARGLPVTARGGRKRGEALEAAVPRAPGPDLRNRDRRLERQRLRNPERREAGVERRRPRIERNERAIPDGDGPRSRIERRGAERTGATERRVERRERAERQPDAVRERSERRAPRAARPLTAERPEASQRRASGHGGGVRGRANDRETGPSQIGPRTADRAPNATPNRKAPRAAAPVTAERRAPSARSAPARSVSNRPEVSARPGRAQADRRTPARTLRNIERRPEARAPQRTERRAATGRAAPPNRETRNAERATRNAPAVRTVRPDRQARQASRHVQQPNRNVRDARESPRRVQPPVRNLREASPAPRRAQQPKQATREPRGRVEHRAVRQVRPQRQGPARAMRGAPAAPPQIERRAPRQVPQVGRQAPRRMEAAREAPRAAPPQSRQRTERHAPQRVERSAPERQIQRQTRREVQRGRRNARGGRFGR